MSGPSMVRMDSSASWSEAGRTPSIFRRSGISSSSGPICLNPQAARSLLPVVFKKTHLLLAGYTPAAIAANLRAAYQDKQLPSLEPGAMSYMMSKSAYLTDSEGHNTSHVMFYIGVSDGSTLGADMPKSPIASSSYWFPDDAKNPLERGLPTIRVFVVGVKRWSDGSVQAAKPIPCRFGRSKRPMYPP